MTLIYHDGYVNVAPTVDHLLPFIQKRKPNLSTDQQTQVANKAIEIFNKFINTRWMHARLAVKMAIAQLGF